MSGKTTRAALPAELFRRSAIFEVATTQRKGKVGYLVSPCKLAIETPLVNFEGYAIEDIVKSCRVPGTRPRPQINRRRGAESLEEKH